MVEDSIPGRSDVLRELTKKAFSNSLVIVKDSVYLLYSFTDKKKEVFLFRSIPIIKENVPCLNKSIKKQ